MRKKLLQEAEKYAKQNHRRRVWRKFVQVMACVVVFCTTYALILPAITMEKTWICGMEEHVHTDVCYKKIDTLQSRKLICTYASAGGHVHTEACEDDSNTFICGNADFFVHSHDADCRNEDGELVCQLPEIEEHTHTQDCYREVEVASHTHEDACYETSLGDLVCGIEASQGHAHGENCYQQGDLICQKPEQEAHTHGEACSERVLVCEVTVEPHTHGPSCYEEKTCELTEDSGHVHDETCTGTVLACDLTEQPHAHTDGCYQTNITCDLPETEGHAHGAECYEWDLTCELPETEGHAHTDSCREQIKTLICPIEPEIEVRQELDCEKEEIEVHSHEDACYETELDEEGNEQKRLVCEKIVVLEHVHGENCFVTEEVPAADVDTLTCTLTEGHVHGEGCYDESGKLTCPEEENHVHGDICYGTWELICGKEEHTHTEACRPQTYHCGNEAHSHEENCYDAEGNLICELAEHIHSEACLAEPVYYCGLEPHGHDEDCRDAEGNLICQLPEHAHSETCLVKPVYYCGLEPHGHDEDCRDAEGNLICELVEHAHSEECLVEPDFKCGKEEHAHDKACYDADGSLTCGKMEHTHILACRELFGEALARVEAVITAIDAMPSADEIEANVAIFREQDDEDGEIAYLEEVYAQVQLIYLQYRELGEELQRYVINADKLLELEYIWSADVLAVTTNRPTIYQINSYEDSTSADAVMVFGGTVKEKVKYQFLWWYSVKVERDDNGYYRVVEILTPGSTSDKSNVEANETGFVLLFSIYRIIPDTKVGDYVTVNFTIPDTGIYKAAGYGTVSFSSIPPINSDSPTPTWYTSTKDFIELNLYDYENGINERWDDDKKYPGFQWNGGAYAKTSYRTEDSSADAGIPNNITDRNYIDSIDFGNSLITNYEYQGSNYAKSTTATGVGYLYNNSNAANTGKINWLWYDGSNYASTTNRPVGFSTQVVKSGTTVYTQSIANTLKDGYPALIDGTSLAYLFGGTSDSYVIKKNTDSIDGLFQQNATTGEYSYNSRINHAQYSNNKFTLYEEIITPNFITYPFGNFLPLNTISDTTKSTQVGAFNYEGGMGQYVEGLMEDLQDALDRDDDGNYSDTSRSQLLTMLAEYKENWERYPLKGTSTYWYNLSPANAIRDYFFGDSNGNGDAPSDDDGFITQAHLNKMYNIDWDVATNFFFGMEMKMKFLQPKDGMTGKDTNGDGEFDYPMEFYFTGDDDVWVFIDDVLYLDLTGIHRHVGGKIDFVNGWVYYYELDVENGGDVSSTPYAQYSFAAILRAAGWSDTEIDEVLKPINSAGNRPFKDYSTHTFNFYYIERGSGSSVCRLNFNFPLLRQNTIAVEKELSATDSTIAALGNPDFKFQILDVDDNGNKTENSFFAQYDDAGSQWAYTLYDVDSSKIQEVEVTERNEDGTVKTLTVYNSEHKIVRQETQDENGNAVITNYPENGDVLTIDEYGMFTLKAGQKAEFVGIPENWDQYYVRELIDNIDVGQYGSITVSGTAATERENVTVGGTTYKGLESPIMNMSDGSTVFKIKNEITTAKLGDLSITKAVPEGIVLPEDKAFDMEVKLDGVLLPVGTSYTVTDGATTETKTVATAGLISLKAGQTATIANILSGTQFEVVEASGSAEGYVVESNFEVYEKADAAETKVENPADIDVITNGVSGIIRNSTRVSVVITNTPNEAKVEIPGTKTVGNGNLDTKTERTYTFTLTQVANAQGAAMEAPFIQEQSVTVKGTATGEFLFEVPYAATTVPGTYYYMIQETASSTNDVIMDTSHYIAAVTVTKKANGLISAELTSLTKSDGTTVEKAAFVNTLTGEMSLEKQVDGSEAAQTTTPFSFRITLKDQNGAPVTGQYSVTAHNTDGATTGHVIFDGNGTVTVNQFHHGEKLVIHGLPLGTEWTIQEVTADGYIVSWTIDDTPADGTENGVSGVLNANVQVVCTNTSTYKLPETGGGGTIPYTMAGLVLMLFSMAYLMYRPKARRREEF